MQIHVAVASDADGVLETHVRAIRELCAKDYTSEQIAAWTETKRATDYAGPISKRRMVIAQDDKRIVGFGEYNEERKEICALYVDPDFTRRGIGRALFLHLLDGLRAHGIGCADLDASLTSVPFYLSMGCRKIEVRMHALRGGVSIPSVRMRINW